MKGQKKRKTNQLIVRLKVELVQSITYNQALEHTSHCGWGLPLNGLYTQKQLLDETLMYGCNTSKFKLIRSM